MRLNLGCLLVTTVAALGATGCQHINLFGRGTEAIQQQGRISVHELAGRLGLQVTESDSLRVVLRGRNTRVTIFPLVPAEIYVNGKPIGANGEIYQTDGVVYLSQDVEQRIRQAMGLAGTIRPSGQIPRGGRLVVIDAGHGGKDPGAISVSGYSEKTVNLAVALEAAQVLRSRGFQVSLTRQVDRFIELNERSDFANRLRPAAFVSIHCDSSDNPSARGFTVYVSRSASRQSRSLANSMILAMSQTSLSNRGIGKQDYRVLKRTSAPAVLVELGFISNWREAGLLSSRSFQGQLGQAIARGVEVFLQTN